MKKEEELLFTKWTKKRPEMAKDGIVNENEYLKSNVKVLYILKEVNDWKEGDLRDLIKEGKRWRTWNNIARWQNGIQKYYESGELIFKNHISKNDRIEFLKSIAVLNLKKESGGATSNYHQIMKHATEDKALLKEQINLYKPDVIICCGTGEFVSILNLAGDRNFKPSSNGTKYSKNNENLIISYKHPQARVGKRILFDNLMDVIKEVQSL